MSPNSGSSTLGSGAPRDAAVARVSDEIEIAYETMGDGVPLVLVMGIGASLVYWPDPFCEKLAQRGFRVIRFDHRDTGRSTVLDRAPVPNLYAAMASFFLGLRVAVPYTLVDMADDVAGLLDALEVPRAHVVGTSMGGMIAQTMAIVHPHRVASLTSISSTTGERLALLPKPRALQVLLQPPPHNRAEAEERALRFFRTVGSPAFPLVESDLRDRAGRNYDRGFYPRGFVRQFAAVLASGSRRGGLQYVRTPTLVVHGAVDPLVPVAGGRATARAVAGARLLLIDGMGHDLPEPVWQQVIDGIVGVAGLSH